MTIAPEVSYRIPAVVMAVASLCTIGIVTVGRGKEICLVLKRCVYAVSSVVLLCACFFIVIPTRTDWDMRIEDARSRWLRIKEPNILNHHLLMLDREISISVPSEHRGTVLTNPLHSDLHVECDSRGSILIEGVQFSITALGAVLSARVTRVGPFRVFIWADVNSPSASRTEMSRFIQESGCTDLYFVVSAPRLSDGKIEYKALSIEESLIITSAWNANKNLEPISGSQ